MASHIAPAPTACFAQMLSCEILGEEDCECPEGHRCETRVDKGAMPWMECAPVDSLRGVGSGP